MTEAQRLYEAIFGGSIPSEVATAFDSIPPDAWPPVTPAARAAYHRMLDEVRDLESLEFASRVFGQNQQLTTKFRLMAYLAESYPRARRQLVNRRNWPAPAVWQRLGFRLFISTTKLIKGTLLLRRYRGA